MTACRPITIGCGVLRGVDAVPVVLEVSLRDGTDTPRILGQVDAGVREAYYRVLGAFVAQGLPPPRGAPTMNFTPATVRKSGSGFDLPMALGLAGASGQFAMPPTLAALGEVSLSGEILPAPGAVAVALAARARGWTRLLAAPGDAALASLVPGIEVYGIPDLRAAIRWLRGEHRLERATPPPPTRGASLPELADIRGHETPKTALLVAVTGRHNLLMVGPPGSGKTALVQRMPALLPPTTADEALEILKIHTARGHRGRLPEFSRRPMRAPHHTSSAASLLGGGCDPRPGEVSLAQHGILFLDELPEFRREVLEGLRQPLEDGELTIGRVRGTVTMPADFLLVGAMNPCPCGYHGHQERPCACHAAQRARYRARVSGPLLDRLDLQVEVPALPAEEWRQPPDPRWSTRRSRARVLAAVRRQRARNPDGVPNGRLRDAQLEATIGTDAAVHQTVEEVIRAHRMSGRARVRLLRIARTVADLAGREQVDPSDIHAAARLRGFADRAP